ncbi:MAG: NAD-dependent deacetylase [Acidobacteriota bacterium]|jgi:NAD-dependent deacetylase|nr:NAD-dependent deacetylase [Acidobacteriota bacterium]
MDARQHLNIPGELRERLRSAQSVFVLTGAGVSAESGVPTFRGGGNAAVWKGMPFEVISSAGMVRGNLLEVWEWFDYRRGVLGHCRPNPAHATIARWQERFPVFTLATQNVDGLHAEAGSREVLELHGNVWRARCMSCGRREDLRVKPADVRPPLCDECGGQMRPDVVLFGELLPERVWISAAERAAGCDLCFVVGTSALVNPAAGLPYAAAEAGAFLVEVNPEPTPLSEACDVTLRGAAGEILPLLDTEGV